MPASVPAVYVSAVDSRVVLHHNRHRAPKRYGWWTSHVCVLPKASLEVRTCHKVLTRVYTDGIQIRQIVRNSDLYVRGTSDLGQVCREVLQKPSIDDLVVPSLDPLPIRAHPRSIPRPRPLRPWDILWGHYKHRVVRWLKCVWKWNKSRNRYMLLFGFIFPQFCY